MHLLRRDSQASCNSDQEPPKYGLYVSLGSDIALTLVSAFALYSFYSQVSEGDYYRWPYLAYGIMLANGLIGLAQFATDNALCSMHCLFDYLQMVLVLPAFAAEVWTKYNMEPPIVAHVLGGLGVVLAVLFTALVFKHQYLTDVLVLIATGAIGYVGYANEDYYVIAAAIIFLAAYGFLKRKEIVCDEPLDIFNLTVAGFTTLSLISLGVQFPNPAELFSSTGEE